MSKSKSKAKTIASKRMKKRTSMTKGGIYRRSTAQRVILIASLLVWEINLRTLISLLITIQPWEEQG